MSADPRDPRPPDETRELLSRLEASLAAEHDAAIPPGDAEIAAYVDGTLDEVALEIFETRLADDPALQAEVAGLRDLRATLDGANDRRSGPASRPTAWLAAAAAIAIAATAALIWLVSPGPTALRLQDGDGTIVVHADGTVDGLRGLSADLEAAVRETLRTGQFPRSSRLDRVRVEEWSLMSGEAGATAFRAMRPVGTFVRSDRPTFQWSLTSAATHYQVSVYDERFDLIVESPLLDGGEWTVPSPLPRATPLIWQVEAVEPGGRVLAPSPPAPQARFQILSESEVRSLDERLGGAGGSHVARAVILTEAALLDEARREMQALRKQNPSAPLVDELLTSLEPRSPTP